MNDRINDLYCLADKKNYFVDENCPRSIAAMSVKLRSGIKIISLSNFDKSADDEPREPYTKLECFAHEMGHCETDSFYSVDASLKSRLKHEYRANKWAINYVIPFTELCEAVAEGNRELWQLAEYFDVSPAFVEKAVSYHEQHGNVVPRNLYQSE